ncbi:hypothetical protein LTR35_009729 [Friedmanniomyces endolithicus]|uniref:Major facilitator superfamily (MFS) profile domain-containing protein n=1 Tax=Friedmanniomyces endolithicus TaxID=329885 RepID=A0AAN6FNZ5_9PEZI|nr:hypothetical protein LTR35_009729 [Friedmanniomyces endolithicus]KAK0321347.1 hypothetical protein LTR82_007799 [Friedmanniomyces endolithicus]KAK1018857.1 hypothetical protein LTR54_000668 [Friedmanniomyces endolithicus]
MEKDMHIKPDGPSVSTSPDEDLHATKEAEGIRDVAADLFLEIGEYSPEELEAERTTVRKKLDMIIMPIGVDQKLTQRASICITYCLQFLDKLSLNYASAYTFIPDLGLEGHRYSWVAAIFNFGYLFWALPANLLIQKLPIGKLTGTMIFIWSILLIAHVGAKNYGGILVLRFLLGMFEAGISPSIMSIVSMFYTRAEQPWRMCIFLGFNGMSTIVGSLLGYGLGHVNHAKIASWQLIFLVIGLMNFVWSIVFITLMPDSAANARFLTHKQKVIAVDRIAKNMVGVKTKQYKMSQVFEALLDVKVWTLILIGLATGVINGGVSNFGSSLIKGFGFSSLNATLLQLPNGVIEFLTIPTCGLIATYVKDVRCLTIMVVCLIPLGGLLGIRLTSLAHPWSLVGSSWLQGIVGAPIILCWNLLTTNIAGHTKRSVANGLWFVFYAAGNIVGANIFDTREAPRYFSALTGMIVCYCATIALAGFLWVFMAWENKRRDRVLAAGERTVVDSEDKAVLDGFKDRTDKENQGFRYGL